MNSKEKRVLFIDDNRDATELFKAAAEQVGIVPFVSNDGTTALKLLEENEFDAVILDLSMAVMDGLTLSEQIRMNESLHPDKKPVCIVYYTAHNIDRAILAVAERARVERIYQKGGGVDILDMLMEIKDLCEPRASMSYKPKEKGKAQTALVIAFIGIVALILTISYFNYLINAQKRDFDNTLHAQQETAAYKWAETKSQRDSVKNNCDQNARALSILRAWNEQQGHRPPPETVPSACNYIEQK
jgi:CheY-like chemotaxis protein